MDDYVTMPLFPNVRVEKLPLVLDFNPDRLGEVEDRLCKTCKVNYATHYELVDDPDEFSLDYCSACAYWERDESIGEALVRISLNEDDPETLYDSVSSFKRHPLVCADCGQLGRVVGIHTSCCSYCDYREFLG